jgi:uncharacterized protein (TIGR02757 family)
MTDLKPFLERLYARYHSKEFLSSDPLEFLHRYRDPLDQETVGLIAALLAYGNVKQIRRSVADVLERMERFSGGPASFVRALGEPARSKAAERAFAGFVHRMNTGEDLLLLLRLLGMSQSREGSLGAHFVSRLDSGALDFSDALNALIFDWKAWAKASGRKRGPSFLHLLNAPQDGSVCKRWSMYLRWMGRRDELDLGIWQPGTPLVKGQGTRGLASRQLVMPLDTHVGRLSRKLGLTQRKSLNWKASQEVTASLRKLDPLDPVRYDFSLCRMGILDVWETEAPEAIR